MEAGIIGRVVPGFRYWEVGMKFGVGLELVLAGAVIVAGRTVAVGVGRTVWLECVGTVFLAGVVRYV